MVSSGLMFSNSLMVPCGLMVSDGLKIAIHCDGIPSGVGHAPVELCKIPYGPQALRTVDGDP